MLHLLLFRIYYSIHIKLIFGFPHILKMKFWILLKDALLQFFKSPILKVYSLTCCRSESLATLFDEAEETPEPVEQDLGEPVTEEPSWGVRQKGGTQK